MAPLLYMIIPSPPVRAVQMTAKAIGLELELNEINLRNNEHLTPEYLKMNPQHTVPTLVDDDGFIVWESHAIMPYLVAKYAKDKSLYPEDIKVRATIDQRLHFESGVFFPLCLRILGPIIRNGKTTIDKSDSDTMLEYYGFLEAFLEGNEWVAGDFVSIADFSLISSVTTSNVLVPIDSETYPNITNWLERAEALPAYEANVKGLEAFTAFFNLLMTA